MTTNNSMLDSLSNINISFNGGDLSSDTGGILLLSFISTNRLLDQFAGLPYNDQRTRFSEHNSNDSLLFQTVLRYLLGFFTQKDQETIQNDPLLSQFFPAVSSQPTVSRFLPRITEETNNAFGHRLMDFGCSFANAHTEEILIDADSTKTDTYGKQEDSAYIPHYQSVGYHPIVVNEYHTKVLLASFLRKGNTYSADECVALMEEILKRIDKDYRGKTRPVKFRGDAAFFNHELMELFEEQESPVLYAIRAKGYGRMEGDCTAAYYASEHSDDFTYTSSSPYYGEIEYAMTGSENSRRICFKLWFSESTDKENQICLIPHVFGVITNLEDDPRKVIEFYCQRGNSENFTKELKNDFGANTLSHEQFVKNAFEFFTKSLAYNLFQIFRNLVLEGEDQKMQAGTFRRKYQKVASRLSRHARKGFLRIASSFRYRKQFMKYFRRSCLKLPDFIQPEPAV